MLLVSLDCACCGSSAVVAASWFFQYPGVNRVPLPPQPGTTAFAEEHITNVVVPVRKPKTTAYAARTSSGASGGNPPSVESWIASTAAPSGV